MNFIGRKLFVFTALINFGVVYAQSTVFLDSGDLTVGPSHPGYDQVTTSTGGNAGTLTIESGASLIDSGSRAPYRLWSGASIAIIDNQGTLKGNTAPGMLLEGTVGQIINKGTITSNGYYGIQNSGAITSITNTGVISHGSVVAEDIYNSGSIGTLNNSQGGLIYRGNLPSNYNVIVRSTTSYGQMSVSGIGSSTTNFGIYSGSSFTSDGKPTVYRGVLSGMSMASIGAGSSGTYGGGLFHTNWTLAANASNSTQLDLTTTTAAVIPNVSGQSGSALAQALQTTASGASGNATLASGTTLAAAAQGLTQQQAAQLSNAHAEGYSSNMTIGLEQMAHITNTVMDRIHAPTSSSPTTKIYQDDEGRYIWADAAAVKGTVNSNNNLAGFGYNLYDLIIGGDIKRTQDGGYGVYAGAGTTSMTESQQVTQNFNTTNYYAGLYGAHNFAEKVKLSGAFGYMYGNTNANRSVSNIGLFTGGNATSSYKTNGVYGAAKLAKAFELNEFTVSPFVGASYSQLWMGGATEQGGNDFNFGINSATAYTAVTFAGLDFVYPLIKGINNPLSLVGFYKLGYDWFANSNSAHSITATSPIYGSFTQVGANMGPVSNMVGLGIQGGITRDISARIGAVASYNTYGHEYGGGAQLRLKF